MDRGEHYFGFKTDHKAHSNNHRSLQSTSQTVYAPICFFNYSPNIYLKVLVLEKN